MGGRRRVALVVVVLAAAVLVVVWRPRGGERAPAVRDRAADPTARVETAPPAAPRRERWIPGARPMRIAGRVVAEGAGPAAGATVRLHVDDDEVARVTADAAGRFDLGVRPPVESVVTASAPGRASAVVDVHPGRAAEALELLLESCAHVRGTLRDSSGGRIVGATIRLRRARWVATSDAEGAFELCVPASDPFAIAIVEADGYGALALFPTPSSARLELVLVAEGVVAGRVIAARGDPVEGAEVILTVGFLADGGAAGGEATTDADGRFRIARLVPARYEVRVRGKGIAWSGKREVVVEPGQTVEGVELTVDPAARVSGKVLSAGQPVGGVELFTTGSAAISLDDGGFVLESVPLGEAALGSRTHEILTAPKLTVAAPRVDGVVIEVRARAAIRGRVLRGGAPVDGARVGIEGSRISSRFARSAADGGFVIDRLDAGTYRLTAEAPRLGARSAPREVTVAAGEGVEGVELELTIDGSIAGVVVDEDGRPVEGATVGLHSHPHRGDARTAADGSFEVRGLAGGVSYQVLVVVGEAVSRAPAIALPADHPHLGGVRLVAKRSGRETVAGKVLDREGRAAPDVEVAALEIIAGWPPEHAPTVARARSDAGGAFVLEGLRTGGVYTVRAATPSGGEATVPGVAPGSRGVVLRLSPPARVTGVLVGFKRTPAVYARLAQGMPQRFSARVDGARFTIDDLPPGRYLVIAEDGHATDVAEVALAPGATANVTLTSRGVATLRGRVSDARGGAPLAGFNCGRLALAAGSDSGTYGERDVTTGADGGFDFGEVPAGRTAVSCWSPEDDPFRHRVHVVVTLAPGEPGRVELHGVRATPGGGWIGVYLDLDGSEPRVLTVVPASPGARAGVVVGDLIVSVGGVDCARLQGGAVAALIAERAPGGTVELVVRRGDEQRSFAVPVEARP